MRTKLFHLYGILIAFLLLPAFGCSQNINTANTRGTLTGVVDRHDAYVNKDNAVDKSAALSDSAVLRQAWQAESVAPVAIEEQLNRVADRHDNYVIRDSTLPLYKIRANLRDTALLRELLKAGKQNPSTRPT